MNGASKILTVSYGTFSCTLEGFDDPFNTMKAIAEYFRDLAADDRYFGAEPPTPDAAMLHRIAEREIQRRVEAKIGEHGVVLRAGDAVAAPQVTQAAAPTLKPAEPAPAEPEVLAEPATPQPALAGPAEAAPAVESAAARLHRLRSAQAQIQASQVQTRAAQPAPAMPLAAAPDAEAYAEDQEPAPLAGFPAANVIADADQPAAPAVAVIEEADQVDLVESEAALDRILAAVQDSPAQAAAAVETLADEAPEEAPVLASLRETLVGLAAQDDQLAADMAEAHEAEPVIVTEDFGLPEDEASVEIEIDAIAASTTPMIDDAAYVAPEEPVAASAELALAADAPAAPQPAAEAALVEIAAPVVTEKLQRARARVIKIRRLDKPVSPPAALSAEDEADLQNTLAALAAEAGPAAATPAPVEIEVEAETAEVAPAPATPAPLPPAADDAAVDRILAATNQQLEVPEVKRRRSAIAHLKAAVLATVADRLSNPKAKAAETDAKADAYRKDLDKVVKPLSSAAATGERPAPLVLVSAQRIERKPATDANRPMPQIVSSTPAPMSTALSVRPRRVTAGAMAQTATSTSVEDDAEEDDVEIVDTEGKLSFAEFAENLGAASLSDLLEAAGAYCTLVLDRPTFSRPLLFQQVTQLPAMAETKREDSLRNFGKLLRDGRFQKTARGQFALADTSPILTEAKRLAG